MILRLSLIISLLATVSSCGNRDTCGAERLEMPEVTVTDSTRLVQYEGFTLLYNLNRLTPQWVAWELEEHETDGTVGRCSGFKVDCSLDFPQADNDDYRNSGWDRGHMAPAGDMKWSATAMRESFYYTNACPQNRNLNGGVWKSLEEKCRSLAQDYGRVWIACGPIYRECAYGCIGPHKVAVPDAFYKVLLVRRCGRYHGIAFICDNRAGRRPLEEYVTTIDEVEAVTGLDFFCGLDAKDEASAESQVEMSIWFADSDNPAR